jgi:hypothetical protein
LKFKSMIIENKLLHTILLLQMGRDVKLLKLTLFKEVVSNLKLYSARLDVKVITNVV